ncbi:hypothetical protein KC19_VG232700 [Ceratodon purpureus]|uniref:Uncharacterized protein n=1 Tax=Ceratodon purpureus TaxID=3225 RepID=A0A8T0HTB8_CERPU|nr:hypothetical protein KC19_VG232700 [Ceratodon purpureus]
MALLDRKDTVHVHNQYVFPKHVSQIFFMDDGRDSDWKVVISHKPWSKRQMGEYDHRTFASVGHAPGTPSLFPVTMNSPDTFQQDSGYRSEAIEVPGPSIEFLDALQLVTEDDAYYDDDQYEEELIIYDGP